MIDNHQIENAMITFNKINMPRMIDEDFNQWLYLNLLLANRLGLYRSVAMWIEDLELNSSISFNDDLKAYTLVEFGKLARVTHNYELSSRYYQEAILNFKNDKSGILSCEMNIANLAMAQGLFTSAIKQFEILNNRDLSKFPVIESMIILNYASAVYQVGDIDRAKKLYNKVLGKFTALKDLKSKAQTLLNLAVIEMNQGKYEKSITLFKESLDNNLLVNNTRGIVITIEYLTKLNIHLNKKKDTLELLELGLSKLSWEDDYRLFSRIAVLYVKLLLEKRLFDKIENTFGSIINTVEIKGDEPAETYQFLFLLIDSFLQMNKKVELIDKLVNQLIKIAKEKNDLESLSELLLSKLSILAQLNMVIDGLLIAEELNEYTEKNKNLKKSVIRQIHQEILLFHIKFLDQINENNFIKLRFYNWEDKDERILASIQVYLMLKVKNDKYIKNYWLKKKSKYGDLLPESHKFVLDIIINDIRKNTDKEEITLHIDDHLTKLLDRFQFSKEGKSIILDDISWDKINLMINLLQNK